MDLDLMIMRHGTTEWMEKGLVHGRMDAPLSELGIKQVQAAASTLTGRSFDGFYSSPTGRAWQTAEIVGQIVGKQPEALDLLMERDFGPREGRLSQHHSLVGFMIHYYLDWLFTFKNGGESLRCVHNRAKEALDMLSNRHPGGSILVVSHSNLINMLLREITGQRLRFFMITPASITETRINRPRHGKVLKTYRFEGL
jgi:broad specificity phosphatase PhoE